MEEPLLSLSFPPPSSGPVEMNGTGTEGVQMLWMPAGLEGGERFSSPRPGFVEGETFGSKSSLLQMAVVFCQLSALSQPDVGSQCLTVT